MENLSNSREWCAIYTRHQHEKAVAERLQAKGFDVFLPLYKSVRHWKDRSKILLLPLFPNYVFLRGAATRRLAALETPGVHTILTSGERLATISDEEIDMIARLVAGGATVEPHPFLRQGERVRIKRGPMAGLEGILLRQKNQSRLILSVEMLERSVGVEIDLSEAEPIGISRGEGSQTDSPVAAEQAKRNNGSLPREDLHTPSL